ncbi:hypothetical protein D9M69_662560 [compost metagenome]
MGTIHDFAQARREKFTQEPYVPPTLIERVPDDIQETLQIAAAERLRRTMKIANLVMQSEHIPPGRELTDDEMPPGFEPSQS